MSGKKLIYYDDQLLLRESINIKYSAEFYLLFLVAPDTLRRWNEIPQDFNLSNLFSANQIFKNLKKLSANQQQKLYDLNVNQVEDLKEIIKKIDYEKSLSDVLSDLRAHLLESEFINLTINIPIGIKFDEHPNYYVINSLLFTSCEDKKLYLNIGVNLKFNELFMFNTVNKYKWTNLWNSIFDVLSRSEVFIGGDEEGSISREQVRELRNGLITQSEIDSYIKVQNSQFVQDFFDDVSVLEKEYALDKQRKKRLYKNKITPYHVEISEKDEAVLEQINEALEQHLIELNKMLDDNSKYGNRYNQNEKKYQEILLKIFPYIFPQYTHFIPEFPFKIDGNSKKNRDIPDFIALNTDMSVDIIEIKTPYKNIFAKNQYRNNYVFDREVHGLLTQAQKYIYNLERNALKVESEIKKQFLKQPSFSHAYANESIHIASPKAIVIIGRSPREFSESEYTDNEKDEMLLSLSILKNRYQDILEFLTYDDIVDRINHIMNRSFKFY